MSRAGLEKSQGTVFMPLKAIAIIILPGADQKPEEVAKRQ
jgi:hypothetical protein